MFDKVVWLKASQIWERKPEAHYFNFTIKKSKAPKLVEGKKRNEVRDKNKTIEISKTKGH